MRNVICLFLLFILSITSVIAGDGVWVKSIPLNSVNNGSLYHIQDRTHALEDVRDAENYEGFIFLNYTRKEHTDLDVMIAPWRLTLNYSYTSPSSSSPIIDHLTISYENGHYVYSDYAKIPGNINIPFGYELTVLNLQGQVYNSASSSWTNITNPQASSFIPDDIEFKLELRSTRYYQLTKNVVNSDKTDLFFQSEPNQYHLKWNYVQGAEEYDLEWVFIDAESAEYQTLLATSSISVGTQTDPFELKEPSRVRVWGTQYFLDKTYPAGTLYFRIRAVSKFIVTGNVLDQIRVGDWNYCNSKVLMAPTILKSNLADHEILPTEKFELGKNWLYGVAYAEAGKSVSSISFYDGSNRARQSMTYNTSDNVTLVSESKFDFEGRQVVSVIPAPVLGRKLGYHANFNVVGTTGATHEFSENDFDMYIPNYTTAIATPLPLFPNPGVESGAAQYFSPSNSFTDDLFRAAIPDAEGYVYSQTIYRNDGSGRIERVGGIGKEFQAAGSHAVETFYGTPTAHELRRLFGNNVDADLTGYRKDMVKDANGQLSVTYYDKRGHVIATGLAGDAPINLIELEGAIEESVTTPLNDGNSPVGPYSTVSEHTFMNAVLNNVLTFNYDLTGAFNSVVSVPLTTGLQPLTTLGSFCSTCLYDLNIEVKNDLGQVITSYIQHIAPTVSCEDGGVAVLAPVNFTVTLPEIGEYRIIKTLTVDIDSMNAAFEAQIESLGNEQTFINNYVAGTDFSGCFDNCDDYCANLVMYQYEHEVDSVTGILIHGPNSFALLSDADSIALVSACLATACNPNDFYDNSIGSGSVETPPTMCSSLYNRMIKQISPNGVFYENATPATTSSFWANILAASVGGQVLGNSSTSYSLIDLQNPTYFTAAVANDLVIYHREYCHYAFCDLRTQSDEYSSRLTTLILAQPWSSTSSIFTNPQTAFWSLEFTTGDPIIGSVYEDITHTFANRISNYIGDHILPPSYDGLDESLFHFVEVAVADMIASLPGTTFSSASIEQMRKNLFIGTYNNIKQEMIKAYNDGLTPPCVTYSDDNAVFPGLLTQAEMEAAALDVIAEIIPGSCSENALASTDFWISQIPTDCLNLLEAAFYFVPGYLPASLVSGSYPGDLQQLFYDFSMNSCPENTWNWFYDPGTVVSDPNNGNTEHDQIITMLQSTCGLSPLSFEAPTPTSTTGTVIPTIPSMASVAIAVNSVFDLLFNMNNPPTGGVVDGVGNIVYTTVLTNPSLPLGISTSTFTYTCTYSPSNPVGSRYTTKVEFHLDLSPSGCEYNGEFTLVSDQRMTKFWYKIPLVVTSSEHVEAVYEKEDGLQDDCIAFLSKSNCLSNTYTVNNAADGYIPIPDFQQDCIESQLAQAAIDAHIIYEQQVALFQNQFLQASANCITSAVEHFSMSYILKEQQYTLYYYDLAGNLIQTVPPQGVNVLTVAQVATLTPTSTLPDHQLETRYEYNGLNSLIGQFTPDGGQSTFYLDKLYRVKYSQNARQFNEHKASYSNYDELGRVVEAGEILLPVSGAAMAAYLQTYADGIGTLPTPSPIRLDYTKTIYEDIYPYDPSIASVFNEGVQENLRNAIGAIEHHQADYTTTGALVAGSAVITVSSYSYDPHKNVKQMVNTNYDLLAFNQQHKTVEYQYDLISGNVNKVTYQKNKLDEFNHEYDYDANNRLIRAFTSHNGDVWEMDAKYFYYLHGALARRELGENKVQGTDYAYNLQGWLKGVNSTTLDENRDLGKDGVSAVSTSSTDNQFFGVDAFGFNLNYFKGDYDQIDNTVSPSLSAFAASTDLRVANGVNGNLYNGNITHMVTAIRKTDESKLDILGNIYKYDQLQRIKSMDAYATVTQADLQTNNSFAGAVSYRTSAFKETYSYDKNGNIKTLTRNGYGVGTGSSITGLEMDNFVYKYATSGTDATEVLNPINSNRLTSVLDDATLNGNYSTDIDGGQGANNYQYDASGQLVKDLDEDIDKIEWTVTGKVKSIIFTPSSTKNDLKFIYDPMDIRVAKIEYTNDAHTELKGTYYVHDAQGNVMSTYEYTNTTGESDIDELFLAERYIYGSSRIGLENMHKKMADKVDLSELPLGSLVYSESVNETPGAWFFTDFLFPPQVEVTSLDYNQDGKMDVKFSHAANAATNTFGAHVYFRTIPGEVYTLEYDVLATTLPLYGITIAKNGSIYNNVYSGAVNHYNQTFTATKLSTDITRLKFFAQNFHNAGSFVIANLTVKGAGDPFNLKSAELPNVQEELVTGDKRYELQNHLSNVLSIVTDRKIPLNSTTYSADVVQYTDYSPFGVELDMRHGTENGDRYRFSYQGSEHDDEIKGEGNSYTTTHRFLDVRLGRWLSIDPLSNKYAGMSPYTSMNNNPITTNDIDGLEGTDWVKHGKGFSWDSSIKTNEQAVKKFGEGAEVLKVGAVLNAKGNSVTLHDNGSYTQAGVTKTAKDYASSLYIAPITESKIFIQPEPEHSKMSMLEMAIGAPDTKHDLGFSTPEGYVPNDNYFQAKHLAMFGGVAVAGGTGVYGAIVALPALAAYSPSAFGTSTELWALKGGISATSQALTNNGKINLFAVAGDAFLGYGSSSILQSGINFEINIINGKTKFESLGNGITVDQFAFTTATGFIFGAKGNTVSKNWNKAYLGRPTNARNIMKTIISNSIYSFPTNGLNRAYEENVSK